MVSIVVVVVVWVSSVSSRLVLSCYRGGVWREREGKGAEEVSNSILT